MTFLSFSEKLKLEKESFIMIYSGRNQYNTQFFAYIICDSKGLEKMHNDYIEKKLSLLTEYGKVIYLDEIAAPDQKAEEFLEAFVENYPKLKGFL